MDSRMEAVLAHLTAVRAARCSEVSAFPALGRRKILAASKRDDILTEGPASFHGPTPSAAIKKRPCTEMQSRSSHYVSRV